MQYKRIKNNDFCPMIYIGQASSTPKLGQYLYFENNFRHDKNQSLSCPNIS
jgi:hypothetical protein